MKVFASLLGAGRVVVGRMMLTPLLQIPLCLEGSQADWQLGQAVDGFPPGYLVVVSGRMVENV